MPQGAVAPDWPQLKGVQVPRCAEDALVEPPAVASLPLEGTVTCRAANARCQPPRGQGLTLELPLLGQSSPTETPSTAP